MATKRLLNISKRVKTSTTALCLYVPGVDVYKLAKGTTGCTGADLENLVNQAALKAAMDAATSVTMEHLEYAQDKILMGEFTLPHCFPFRGGWGRACQLAAS